MAVVALQRRSWKVGFQSFALAGTFALAGGGAAWAAGNVAESSADPYPTSHVALWPDAPVKLTFVRWYEQTYCFAWIDGTSLVEVGCPDDLYIDQDIPEETGPAT